MDLDHGQNVPRRIGATRLRRSREGNTWTSAVQRSGTCATDEYTTAVTLDGHERIVVRPCFEALDARSDGFNMPLAGAREG